ncbi:deoxyribodipyrimidine photolyase [Myxococcota bacterium]|nr:deoxyribodipyrimidine photolyase [Myxococcota bacterium]
MLAPVDRLRPLNDAPLRREGAWVLYWMVASRRAGWSFALDHALARARELGRPLLVLEALRLDHPHASARLHRFVLQGMADNARAFAGSPVGYLPFVEETPGQGRGLLRALADRACLVVTDDWPAYFLPRMQAAAAAALPVRLEAVDGVGLLPWRSVDRAFGRAVDFRRHLQRQLAPHLRVLPSPAPLSGLDLPPCPPLPDALRARWPAASDRRLSGQVTDLPVDQGVGPVAQEGGAGAARARWRRFRDEGLSRYDEERSHPDADASSGLSPWLHFGHLSVHELWADIAGREGWSPERLGPVTASKAGWWGLSASSEAFLDELVTWRELALNGAALLPDHDRYAGTPAWAQQTLAQHRADPRPHRYDLETLDRAQTHDPVWNAAQRQLRESGGMHNYLRMLWGKKVLEWVDDPATAFDILLHLNDRYALDGRDPNSTAGVGWVFGRYDRPWGPVRPIFGTVRYMSSENTVRKLRMGRYLARWG